MHGRTIKSRAGLLPSPGPAAKIMLLILGAIFSCNINCLAEDISTKPATAQRIVSLSPAATEQIFILGAQDRLVGCTIYCTRPAAAEKKEKIGTVLEVNLEKIVSLNPDLVIGSSLTKPGTVEKLKELGFKVRIFNASKDFKTFFSQFIELGELIGEKEKALGISEESQKKMEEMRMLASSCAQRPKVLFQIGSSPMYVAGNDSFVGDFIAYCGGINVLGERRSGVYSREMIVAEDPDVIIISTMGLVGESEKKEWMRFASLKAVRNGRIFIYDSSRICSPSPVELPLTVAEIASLVNPEAREKIRGCLSGRRNEK